MVPRTVQMAKAISTFMTTQQVADYGNVLAATYKGWNNIYYGYFLGSAGEGAGNTLGRPVMFNYSVHSWSGSQPKWAQPPTRKKDSAYGAVLYPVADSLTPPPLETVS